MEITGKNLQLLKASLEHAITEVHNEIATCPDIYTYAEDIEELEKTKALFEKLLLRVSEAIEKEK